MRTLHGGNAVSHEGTKDNCSYDYGSCASPGVPTYGILVTPETAIKRALTR